MSWVRFPSPAPISTAEIRHSRQGLPQLDARGIRQGKRDPKSCRRVLTNNSGIHISAAPPEFSSGELQSQTAEADGFLRTSSVVRLRSGIFHKIWIDGTSRICQKTANPGGSSDRHRECCQVSSDAWHTVNAEANTLLRTMKLIPNTES